ncbi:hypothetical protein GCM10022236_04160 [Microlunatus ginsengisoli]|uniref:Uncharacterized protein n=1 Tax=Microlunatus ginsengisoli TaxID=363863 RepID=A0ABP6ZGI9_9ACTN
MSDKAKADPNSLIGVPESASFDNLVSFRGQSDIGDKVNKAMRKLADGNASTVRRWRKRRGHDREGPNTGLSEVQRPDFRAACPL